MGAEGIPPLPPQGKEPDATSESVPEVQKAVSLEIPAKEQEIIDVIQGGDFVEMQEIVARDFRSVLEAVKLLGPNNFETRVLIVQWTLRREKAVEAYKVKEAMARESILFNTDRAELYVAAGDIDGAIDSLYDAIDQAANEGHEDLRSMAQAKADALTAHGKWL